MFVVRLVMSREGIAYPRVEVSVLLSLHIVAFERRIIMPGLVVRRTVYFQKCNIVAATWFTVGWALFVAGGRRVYIAAFRDPPETKLLCKLPPSPELTSGGSVKVGT